MKKKIHSSTLLSKQNKIQQYILAPPVWPERAWNGVPVAQSVTYILQSPAPPEMSNDDLLLESSMKHISLTVPSCIVNSIS